MCVCVRVGGVGGCVCVSNKEQGVCIHLHSLFLFGLVVVVFCLFVCFMTILSCGLTPHTVFFLVVWYVLSV